MNEFKHTSGDWKVDKEKSGIVRMNDYFRIEQIAMSEYIAEGMTHDDLEAEGNANAKLIAASPNLLEALIELVNCDYTSGTHLYAAQLKAKAVIEKAIDQPFILWFEKPKKSTK